MKWVTIGMVGILILPGGLMLAGKNPAFSADVNQNKKFHLRSLGGICLWHSIRHWSTWLLVSIVFDCCHTGNGR